MVMVRVMGRDSEHRLSKGVLIKLMLHKLCRTLHLSFGQHQQIRLKEQMHLKEQIRLKDLGIQLLYRTVFRFDTPNIR